MKVEPYLFFEGRTEEALEFYRKALDAKIETIMRFGDHKEACEGGAMPPGSENKVMHSAFKIGETTIMASDGNCGGKSAFQGVSLAVTVADDAEAKRRFEALSPGGQVQQPLTKTFFASSFGVLQDRFGVSWMIVTAS